MPPAPHVRQHHNPCQLKCTLVGCKKWFKTAGGRTRHTRSFHNTEAMHRSHPWHPDEAIQSSPPPDATNYASPRNFQDTPRSRLSDIPHVDEPIVDDLFFNDDPFDEPFEDVPFARLPTRNKDGTSIHHPLINGAYRIIIPCAPLMMWYARTTLQRRRHRFTSEHTTASVLQQLSLRRLDTIQGPN
jgi:hypothetical protein